MVRKQRGCGVGALLCSGMLPFVLGTGAPSPGPALRPATAARVLEEVRRPGAAIVLVNVWATWCMPCREEFPDLVKLQRKYASKGLRLVLVSADFDDRREEQVRSFLSKQGVDFPSFLKEGDDMEFIDGLEPKWSGALPVTLIYDAKGEKRRFWEGSASFATMERNVLEVLGQRAQKKEAS